MPRTKGSAQKRIDLSRLEANAPTASTQPTLDTMLDDMAPYVAGAIETLGRAAEPHGEEPGDTRAAQIIVEFLGKALQGRAERAGTDILKRIAEIRSADSS